MYFVDDKWLGGESTALVDFAIELQSFHGCRNHHFVKRPAEQLEREFLFPRQEFYNCHKGIGILN